jgi:hypothetical protein
MKILISGTEGYIGAGLSNEPRDRRSSHSRSYEARTSTRLRHLRYLQRTGQIDGDLFWNAR